MTTFVYRSSDTGAPGSITGAASNVTLAAVLRGCLLNGYNSQSGVTATQSGGIATFTKTAHGFNQGAGLTGQPGQVLTITGFTTAGYNITKGVVLSATANTWTMAVAGGTASPAVGTGTAIVAPADWLGSLFTEPFSASGGIAVFKWPAVATNNFYFRLDENTNAQNAQGRFYESMSALSTGVSPWPSLAQIALGSGPYMYKSITADATARAWELWTNGRVIHLFLKNAAQRNYYRFGDIQTNKSGDLYNTLVGLDSISAATGASNNPATNSTGVTTVLSGHFMARRYDQTGTSITASCCAQDSAKAGGSGIYGAAGLPFPNGPDGKLVMTGIDVYDAVLGNWRGSIPGVWDPCHVINSIVVTNDIEIGTDNQAGKTFELMIVGSNASAGCVAIETSDTWTI